MELLFVFITTFVLFLAVRSIKIRLDKYLLYLLGGYFCVTLIISIFNPFGLYPVDEYTYFVLSLGFCSFFIGYALNKKKIKQKQNVNSGISVENLLQKKWFQYLFFLSFAILFYLAVTQFRIILLQGSLGNLKLDFFELVFNNNSGLYFVYQVLLFPLFHFCSAAFSYLALTKGKKIYMLFLLLYAMIFAFVGGKRGYFAIILEYYVISYAITKIRQGAGIWGLIRSSYKIIMIILFAYIGAALMTSLSGGDYSDSERIKESGVSNAKNIVIYTAGAYRALNIAIDGDYVDKAGGYHILRNTLGGAIDYYGTGIISRMGYPIKPITAYTMTLLQEKEISVGKDTDFNYAYTAFMYFYSDLGLLGVILYSFLFGWLVRLAMKLYASDYTVGSLGLICFFVLSASQMTGSWFNIALSAQPTLFMFYYLRKKELKNIR